MVKEYSSWINIKWQDLLFWKHNKRIIIHTKCRLLSFNRLIVDKFYWENPYWMVVIPCSYGNFGIWNIQIKVFTEVHVIKTPDIWWDLKEEDSTVRLASLSYLGKSYTQRGCVDANGTVSCWSTCTLIAIFNWAYRTAPISVVRVVIITFYLKQSPISTDLLAKFIILKEPVPTNACIIYS